MSSKRLSSQKSDKTQNKRAKLADTNNYLHVTLRESGLTLKHPPDKCTTTQETIHIIRSIKKTLENHIDYPRNVSDLFSNLEKECNDKLTFKHYLFPNIMRSSESGEEYPVGDSVIKILLSIPILQSKLSEYIFEKAIDMSCESECGPWIQMILKCFSSLDSILDTDKMATNLINLLDVAQEKMVKLEVITAIPDIVGDQEHDNIATEMSRILSEDHELIPAILDCLSHLCLSDDQYEQLQKKTLMLLMTLSKYNYFPNFVKFLLLRPGTMSDNASLEAVQGLRNALDWPSTGQAQDNATSQVLTASAIRNSIVSSKVIGNRWIKVVSSCKTDADHKPIDFIIMIILYSTSEEKQRQVDNLIRKQIKLNILQEELLQDAFKKFKPILKEYLSNLIELCNCLLKTRTDPTVQAFASQMYTLMLAELEECCPTIVAELLQLGLDCKQSLMSILLILNKAASKNMSLLKPQSVQMLSLLDRMDDMSLEEVRGVMNLLCGLAYSYENSVIRDDIHMIIRKELSSSNPTIKIQGILAAIHAVKYLMVADLDGQMQNENEDDDSDRSVSYVLEGDIHEAVQIIELISRSTKQYPDMIAFFYDELSKVIQAAPEVNKTFLSWLINAVENDLKGNFIVDEIESDRINELKVTLQYCLNDDSEVEGFIAINIAGLTLQKNSEDCIAVLSPLFQLVQTLHFKHRGTLSDVDALLGCPIVMPKFDIDMVEDMDLAKASDILNCLVHCVNWFRELLNAFANQDREDLKGKTLKRIMQIEELEALITEILVKTNITYKPPVCTFNIHKYAEEQSTRKTSKGQNSKQKTTKKPAPDDTVLPETLKSQPTQNNMPAKGNLEICHNISLRKLNLKLLHLINTDMTKNKESDTELTVNTLNFLLKSVIGNVENVLISKIKRKTFLTKQESVTYDAVKAEEYAKAVSEALPKLMEHLGSVTSFLEEFTNENQDEEREILYTSEVVSYITCLEYIYNLCTIYFKWIGFSNRQHIGLLKSSLRTITNAGAETVSLKDLLISVAQFLQKHEKYCLQLSTAVALIEFLKSVQNYSDNKIILKILRNVAEIFLSKQWRTIEGALEKGLHFNQSVDRLASIYLINNEILALKNITLQLIPELQSLTSRTSTLNTLKCINKGNFSVLYRNLGTALHDATKMRLDKGMTNSEHMELWKDVTIILKNMSDIAKTLETRNNLSVFFKKSLPVLKLFRTQGIPILELQLKSKPDEVCDIIKHLQQSTRFLHSLCCHSRLKKDTVLMSKVPQVRHLLETLIYKVKAALVANKCSKAFWLGNLKNKDIHGEVIASQASVAEGSDDDEEQLPEDEDSEDSDGELNPESRSASDIL